MVFQLQAATNKARAATGDKHIGTQVSGGLFDVVRAVPSTAGRFSVTVLRGGLTMQQAIAHLGAMSK